MSAKKPVQSNTLFNYFSSPKNKVPPSVTPKKEIESRGRGRGDVKSKENTPIIKKNIVVNQEVTNEDSEEEIQRPAKRQRRALIQSESESENESLQKRKSQQSKQPTKKSKLQSSDDESEDDNSSRRSPKTFSSQKCSMTSFAYSKTEKSEFNEELLNKAPEIKETKIKRDTTNIDSGWLHDTLDFLKPEKIRDADKRRPTDPDYDHRTLHVPKDYLEKLTPAMRQWWILKSQNFDTVLFFKVGKFYELYHMDAVVGVQQLGFSYMRGEFAHSGFPETAYGKMATALIDKGFKVARVEQTETPEMMADRCKTMKNKVTKFDKVVAREICQVSSKASCIYGAQMPEPRSEIGTYLVAISAKVTSDNTCRFGICFIETSIGIFYISEFDDDKHCSKLLTVFAEYPPGLILTERGVNYGPFKNLLNSQLKDVKQETLATKSQFYSAATTLEKLFSECYFKDKDGKFSWPEAFKSIAEECNPKPDFELALKSLGGIHWFLKNCLLDMQLFAMKLFEKYEPLDHKSVPVLKHVERDHLVLDSTTIENLSLIGGVGSLQKTLDYCKTPFGKRLLPHWICRPLCNIKKIQRRQGAIKELFENPAQLKSCQEILKKLPDLERQVAKIHNYGNRFCAKNHPDSRAIMYEAKTYSKRKILDLLKTLKGFKASQQIQGLFSDFKSELLKDLTQFQPEGMNVDLSEPLKFFSQAFDHSAAETEGTIIPQKGVDQDYDEIETVIADINVELKDYLKEQSRFFGCQVVYFGNEKKRYQLEVPENHANRATNEYQLEGHKKGAKPVKRFSTSETKELLYKMMKAEGERTKIILDLNRRIFEKFSVNYQGQWMQAIHCLSMLDVLCSLAEYATTVSSLNDVCLPVVEPFSLTPFVSIHSGKFPCATNIENFVANDTYMGTDSCSAPLLLLTGPNMGGKSTLMRQVSVIAIMAQIGSFVPATSCSLSLIDRVFTRLGAFDDIVRGQSTFFVELSEASTILRHASLQSLLIIDELGRGTSTHDGNAIASAYVRKLTDMGCRTIFSTHYHTLVDNFVENPKVNLVHMACMVENDETDSEEAVTLLYKLAEGRCPKSFGFNAAKLAGLPPAIVARARMLSKEVEEEDKRRFAFRKIFAQPVSVDEVVGFISSLELA